MIDKIKLISLPLTILIISYIIISKLVPNYHPSGGLKISMNPDSLSSMVNKYLKAAEIQFDEEKLNIKFEENKSLSRWIRSEYKLNEANKILSKSGYAYYWNVNQSLDDDNQVVVTSNSNEKSITRKTSFNIHILDDGKIAVFEREIPDSLLNNSVSLEDARNIAANFIHRFRNDINLIEDSLSTGLTSSTNNFLFKTYETINKSDRTDYIFFWETKTQELFNYSLKASIKGDQVNSFEINVVIPDQFRKSETDIFEVASTIVFILLVIISVTIIGFKRFRAYEVGFKQAIIFGLFILFSFVIKEVLERIGMFTPQLLLGLALGGFFIAGAAVLLWAVSETLFREIWNNKFLTLDLIYNRKILHSIVGSSLLNGIAFGSGLTAIFLILILLFSQYFTFDFSGENFTSYSYVTAKLPILNVFFGIVNAYGLLAVAFFMFLTASIKRFINNDTVFIIVCSLTWAILIPSHLYPLTVGLPVNFVIGIFLLTILIKFDLLTTLLSYLLFKYFLKVIEFSFSTDSMLYNQWNFLIIACLIVFILSAYLIFRKDKFLDYDSITPRFVENITERQRLQKELDVARHVQMSFLPKNNPSVKGVDIVSTCIPAFEVGGDYYDFINLGDNKLGIIIGDVSGKGTQAAFYMTLTKGFLKALAKQNESPAEVLTKMNELFYENVERGRFISMIYAVIDLDQMKIRIARAGHNPILYHDTHGRISLINPTGLALGLEKGKIFGQVISEYEETLEKGKVFIFYTDGFTEAVNKKGEEYGLDRMFKVAKTHSSGTSKEILDEMMTDINKFIGKAKQHDDMTMVILKIN